MLTMTANAGLLAAPHAAATRDGDVLFLAGFLVLGGCLQLVAAVIGMRRRGDLKSTDGRQLAAVLGKRGAIAFWLVLGCVMVLGGVALGLPRLMR